MKKLISYLIILATVSTILPSNAEPDCIGDFALLDANGKFHQQSWDEMFIGYWTYNHSKSRGQ